MLGTLSRGPTFFCRHLLEPREKAALRQAFSEEDVPTNHTLLQTEPSPGPEHTGHGWEILENNPAKHPLGQKDSSESQAFAMFWKTL